MASRCYSDRGTSGPRRAGHQGKRSSLSHFRTLPGPLSPLPSFLFLKNPQVFMETHVLTQVLSKQRLYFTPYCDSHFHCAPSPPLFIYFPLTTNSIFSALEIKPQHHCNTKILSKLKIDPSCVVGKNMTCYQNTVYGAWSSQQPQTCTHTSQENQLGRAFPTRVSIIWPLQTLKGQQVGISSLSHPCSTCKFPSPKKPPEEGKKSSIYTKRFPSDSSQ